MSPKKLGVTVCLVAVLCGKVNVTGVDRDVGVGVVPANHPQARILGLLTGCRQINSVNLNSVLLLGRPSDGDQPSNYSFSLNSYI